MAITFNRFLKEHAAPVLSAAGYTYKGFRFVKRAPEGFPAAVVDFQLLSRPDPMYHRFYLRSSLMTRASIEERRQMEGFDPDNHLPTIQDGMTWRALPPPRECWKLFGFPTGGTGPESWPLWEFMADDVESVARCGRALADALSHQIVPRMDKAMNLPHFLKYVLDHKDSLEDEFQWGGGWWWMAIVLAADIGPQEMIDDLWRHRDPTVSSTDATGWLRAMKTRGRGFLPKT